MNNPTYTQAQETLILLYRYVMLSPTQVATLLNVDPTVASRILSRLAREGQALKLVIGNTRVAYTPTRNGAELAANLLGEAEYFDPKIWATPNRQVKHTLGTNQFMVSLIKHSKPPEGLVEWLGTRETFDRYSVEKDGRRVGILRADARGVYLTRAGPVLFHVEFDTGTESMSRIEDKFWRYAKAVPQFFDRPSEANVLFVTLGKVRKRRLAALLERLLEHPGLKAVPSFAVTTLGEAEADALGKIWLIPGREGLWSFYDLPRIAGPTFEFGEEDVIGRRERRKKKGGMA